MLKQDICNLLRFGFIKLPVTSLNNIILLVQIEVSAGRVWHRSSYATHVCGIGHESSSMPCVWQATTVTVWPVPFKTAAAVGDGCTVCMHLNALARWMPALFVQGGRISHSARCD